METSIDVDFKSFRAGAETTVAPSVNCLSYLGFEMTCGECERAIVAISHLSIARRVQLSSREVLCWREMTVSA
jgi:hypothetical protein